MLFIIVLQLWLILGAVIALVQPKSLVIRLARCIMLAVCAIGALRSFLMP